MRVKVGDPDQSQYAELTKIPFLNKKGCGKKRPTDACVKERRSNHGSKKASRDPLILINSTGGAIRSSSAE